MPTRATLRSRLWRVAAAASIVVGAGYVAGQGLEVAHGYPDLPAYCTAAPTGAITAVTPKNAAERASKAYSALLSCYSVSGYQFRNEFVGDATLWPDSWAIAALLSLEQSPNPPAGLKQQITGRLASLQQYWTASPSPPGYSPGVPFLFWGNAPMNFDDNNWVALDFLQAYSMWKTPSYLQHAEQVFTLDLHGWQSGAALPHPGGVLWTEEPGVTDRATVSTASAALLGASLYRLTGKSGYLDWSVKMVNWVDSTLKAPDGLYWDHIDANGAITPAKWSYNQGLMIGAYTELYKATGDGQYLSRAQAIAATCIKSFNQVDGPVQYGSTYFDARFFQYLMQLDQVAPDASYGQALAVYAQRINPRMDVSTGAFTTRNRSQYVLEQAAALQIYALYNTSSHTLASPAVGGGRTAAAGRHVA